MNVTKVLALDAAEKMASKIYHKEIQAQHQALITAYETHLSKHIPWPVLGACAEFETWFYTSKNVFIYTNGRTFYENIGFPVPSAYRNVANVGSKEEVEDIKAIALLLVVIESNRDSLINSIYEEILRLKTRKRIAEEFPEAAAVIEWTEPKKKEAHASKIERIREILDNADKDYDNEENNNGSRRA